MEPTAPTPPVDDSGKRKLLALFKDFGPGPWVCVLGGTYAIGFLVLNSYLRCYGLWDFTFLEARCWMAAISFLFAMLSYALFAGRAIFGTTRLLKENLSHCISSKHAQFLIPVALLSTFVSLTFQCCISAVLYANVAMEVRLPGFVLPSMLGLFAVDYVAYHTYLPRTSPSKRMIHWLLVSGIGSYVFLKAIFLVPPILVLFLHFIGVTLFINMVLDSVEKGKMTRANGIFTGVFSIIVVAGWAVSFGSSIYGQVKPTLGGPWSPEITLRLGDNVLPTVPEISGTTLTGKLVYRGGSVLLMNTSGVLLSIPESDVHAIIYHKKVQQLENKQITAPK